MDTADPSNDLAARAMSPARPRLVACLRALTGASEAMCARAAATPDPYGALTAWHGAEGLRWNGHVDPREAWEMLCPESWPGDPRRAFAHDEHARVVEAWPRTIQEALALAVDPPGMLAAETLAREFHAAVRGALVGIAASVDPRIVWRVVEPRDFRPRVMRDVRLVALSVGPTLDETSRAAASDEIARVTRAATVRLGGLARDVARVAGYRRASAASPRRGVFEALYGVWAMGYAVDAVRDDVCVLAAPTL